MTEFIEALCGPEVSSAKASRCAGLKEVKRLIRVATVFPNEASLLRLSRAVLMEINEGWETGKIYLNLKQWLATKKVQKKSCVIL